MDKNMKFDAKVDIYEKVSENLVPVKVRLMHDGVNRNYSSLSKDVIELAKESIKNKPILASIKYDENTGEVKDFGSHDVEYIMVDSPEGFEYKERFIEYPVGIIPESTVFEWQTENDKNYLSCTGYIFDGYSNETLDLLENSKSVSVELSINEYKHKTKDDNIEICDFTFLGVTILGDDITPGMDEYCMIERFNKNDKSKETLHKFSKMIDEIENTLKKEDEDMENTEIIEETVEIVEEETPVVEENMESTEEVVVEEPIEEEVVVEESINYEEIVKNLELEISNMNEELTTLREFKLEYDLKVKYDELNEMADTVIVELGFKEEDVVELKEQFTKEEINLEMFTLKLKAKRFDEGSVSKKTEFAKETVKVAVVDSVIGDKIDPVVENCLNIKEKYIK